MSAPRRAAACLALLLAGSAAPATGLRAQVVMPAVAPPPDARDGWTGEFAVLGVNGLLGALTGGIVQELRRGSFRDGFTRGFLGGAVVYAGKRVAVERFDGAGLLGRQVAAVGASIVRNAADARPSLSRIVLPLGPVRLEVAAAGDGGGLAVRPGVELFGIGMLAYGIARPELDFDATATLSAGAPVFVAPQHALTVGDSPAGGIQAAGTILLGSPAFRSADTFAHERVHVLQNDQFSFMWGEPIEDWLWSHVPGGDAIGRYIDLNALPHMLYAVDDRPSESEAKLLARRRR